jgi:hypothetical protein
LSFIDIGNEITHFSHSQPHSSEDVVCYVENCVGRIDRGGGVQESHTQQRTGEVPDFLSSKVLPGENLQLGKEGKRDTHQEKATKDDDLEIPYHLCNLRLTILWAGDELFKPHNYGMSQEVEVL